MKTCKTCGSSANGFYKNRRECIPCVNVRHKKHYEADKRSYRARNLNRLFGMSLAEYEGLHEAQSGLCLICGRPSKTDRLLAVDHDHTTGEVRGLLCNECNVGLGMFEDQPEWLERAAQYVRGS